VSRWFSTKVFTESAVTASEKEHQKRNAIKLDFNFMMITTIGFGFY
jgi:hypothetical protein